MNRSIKVTVATALSAVALAGLTSTGANAAAMYAPSAHTSLSCLGNGNTQVTVWDDNHLSRATVGFANTVVKPGTDLHATQTVPAGKYGQAVTRIRPFTKAHVTVNAHGAKVLDKTVAAKACPTAQLGDTVDGVNDMRLSNPTARAITLDVEWNLQDGKGWHQKSVTVPAQQPLTYELPVSAKGTRVLVMTSNAIDLLNTTATR